MIHYQGAQSKEVTRLPGKWIRSSTSNYPVPGGAIKRSGAPPGKWIRSSTFDYPYQGAQLKEVTRRLESGFKAQLAEAGGNIPAGRYRGFHCARTRLQLQNVVSTS